MSFSFTVSTSGRFDAVNCLTELAKDAIVLTIGCSKMVAEESMPAAKLYLCGGDAGTDKASGEIMRLSGSLTPATAMPASSPGKSRAGDQIRKSNR